MITLAIALLAVAAPAPPADRAVVASPLPSQTSSEPTSGRSCVAVDVQPTPQVSRPSRRAWAARHVVDLEIRASLRSARDTRPVELRVLAPGGHLYRTLTASRPEPSTDLSRTSPVATARLSVAGSPITQRGLYGQWVVVPYLAGDLNPCGPSTSFTLEP